MTIKWIMGQKDHLDRVIFAGVGNIVAVSKMSTESCARHDLNL